MWPFLTLPHSNFRPKKKDQDIFKFTKDGRLIISDVDDVKAKKKLKKSILDDSDEEEEQAKLNVKNKAKSRIDDDGSDFETKVGYFVV